MMPPAPNGQAQQALPKNPFEPLQRRVQVGQACCSAQARQQAARPASGQQPARPARVQVLLDRSTPFVLYRWLGLLAVALIYAVRVYFLQGCGGWRGAGGTAA